MLPYWLAQTLDHLRYTAPLPPDRSSHDTILTQAPVTHAAMCTVALRDSELFAFQQFALFTCVLSNTSVRRR